MESNYLHQQVRCNIMWNIIGWRKKMLIRGGTLWRYCSWPDCCCCIFCHSRSGLPPSVRNGQLEISVESSYVPSSVHCVVFNGPRRLPREMLTVLDGWRNGGPECRLLNDAGQVNVAKDDVDDVNFCDKIFQMKPVADAANERRTQHHNYTTARSQRLLHGLQYTYAASIRKTPIFFQIVDILSHQRLSDTSYVMMV